MTNKIEIGSRVERNQPGDKFAHGRRGEVIEIDSEAMRARVCWTEHKVNYVYDETAPGQCRYDGTYHQLKPIRTWVNFRFLIVI